MMSKRLILDPTEPDYEEKRAHQVKLDHEEKLEVVFVLLGIAVMLIVLVGVMIYECLGG